MAVARNSESYHLIMRVDDDKGTEIQVTSIPKDSLDFFDRFQGNYYTRHDHDQESSRLNNFRSIEGIYLDHIPLMPYSTHCVVNDCIYSLYGKKGNAFEFWVTCFPKTENRSPSQKLPSPICATRVYPTCFSLCGLVFLWAGLIDESGVFAEFYNPLTSTWTSIQPPPASDESVGTRTDLLIAPLGEVQKTVIFYDYYSPQRTVYLYHVLSQEWTEYTTNNIPPDNLNPKFMFMSPIINPSDERLYWIDKRRGFIYALDWKTMRVYNGPLVGGEQIAILDMLKELDFGICLNHLWGCYFCLVWSMDDRGSFKDHYTFLKIVVDDTFKTGLLKVFVMGCFVDEHRSSHVHCILDSAI